jgi:hypothetical protein
MNPFAENDLNDRDEALKRPEALILPRIDALVTSR